jgi:sialate O-acetylesterase
MRGFVAPTGSRLAAATLLAFGLCAPPAAAEVALPNVFSDHMVLQRKQLNRVWGKASPGEKVVVTIGGQSHEATLPNPQSSMEFNHVGRSGRLQSDQRGCLG